MRVNWIEISGIIATVAVLGLIMVPRATDSVEVPMRYRVPDPLPEVIICPGAPDGAEALVRRAITRLDLWMTVYPDECTASGEVHGAITVDAMRQDIADMPGAASVHPDDDEFTSCVIGLNSIVPGPAERVVAHELMHCLGFGHASTGVGCAKMHPTGHLMNSKLEDGGWDTTGMDI